jgi:hypothetical protein
MYFFQPLKADVHLKTAQKFNSYLTENTTQLYFKDKQFNPIYKNNSCL